MATAVVSYTLGFEQPQLDWHKKHGPDQVGRHATGLWGIFEAKGGKSRLSREWTSKGTQMSGKWISDWLDTIIARNKQSDAGRQLETAMDSHQPMLAAVSRLSMEDLPGDRVGVEFHLGFQKYDPPKGSNMVDWKGF